MLEMSGVSFAHHGRPPCLEGIDLTVDPGQAVVLEGASGAGKSTLLRLACGLIPRAQGGRLEGRITLSGDLVPTLPIAELPGRIGWVPQDPETGFVARTVSAELDGVLTNLGWAGRTRRLRLDEVLHAFSLEPLAEREVATLSGGEAARLALAAAIVGEPELLVLDEPLAQLDAEQRDRITGLLRGLRAGGLAVLAASHRPDALSKIDPRVLQLPAGTPPVQLTPPSPPPRPPPGDGDPLLVLEHALHAYDEACTLEPIELAVRPGEVVALTGANGSGKTTALHLAAGILEPTDGTVELLGTPPHTLAPPALASRLGICFQHPAWHITQDTVAQEIAVTSRAVGQPVDPRAWADRLGLAGALDAHPWDLSGGERQRLAVATAAAHQPPVLLLDEPTRGLDPANLARFQALLAQRVTQGLATVIATHHTELAELAHRSVRLGAPRAESVPELLPEVVV